MACTTILVGKKASYDGSTLIARNDDGGLTPKKYVVVLSKDQPRKYKSVLNKFEIDLPDNPYKYTACPNVREGKGIWAAHGINEKNVGMTATETITSNPLVMGADPLVLVKKEKDKEIPGGISEEDMVTCVLPYINSAREGIIRLGMLIETLGTSEQNGIAFSDENEIWWLESIGGHNWIARRVEDDEYVIMPNQFGLDRFDFDDAYGKKEKNMCSKNLKDLVNKYHLNLNLDGGFNPRFAFGSHSDSDHVYNTPRAWYIARYFNGNTYRFDGHDAMFRPDSDNIPWALKPEKKITVEDIKYILSSHYQNTPFNPYGQGPHKDDFRTIGISRTDDMAIIQIRNNVANELKAVEWVCFASNPFNTVVALYTNVNKIPEFISNTTDVVDTNNFYWTSRLLGALADHNFNTSIFYIERYQKAVMNNSHNILNIYDEKFNKTHDIKLLEEANEKLSMMVKDETLSCLHKVLDDAYGHMKNSYVRKDN